MSTLQVANVNFESTANNQLVYSLNTLTIRTGGADLAVINSTAINAVSNTFNIGSSTLASNGYTYLPNGLKMNWGMVAAANTAAGTFATFASAFTTSAYVVQVSHQGNARTVAPLVVSSNTTGANISSGIAATTGTNVYFTAIGL